MGLLFVEKKEVAAKVGFIRVNWHMTGRQDGTGKLEQHLHLAVLHVLGQRNLLPPSTWKTARALSKQPPELKSTFLPPTILTKRPECDGTVRQKDRPIKEFTYVNVPCREGSPYLLRSVPPGCRCAWTEGRTTPAPPPPPPLCPRWEGVSVPASVGCLWSWQT